VNTWTGIADDIRGIMRGRVSTDVPLRSLTSFKIGGPADVVAEPSESEELGLLRGFLLRKGIPNTILGGGTNVLCSDQGYRGVVVRTSALKRIEALEGGSHGSRLRAAAGTRLAAVAVRACRAGCKGMEPLWGIPGSVGGAIALNAGAGDVCAGDFIEELSLITQNGDEIVVGRHEFYYGYRRMDLPPNCVVAEGIFHVPAGNPFEVKERLRNWVRVRRERQPWRAASAGCVFKNPSSGDSAGALIDRSGLKGAREGGAEVSDVHANFIVNRGGATAADVLRLIERVRNRVLMEDHVELELEINLLGEGLADV
jgi:UDP-N-acetylmuramate dehydrogenase